jgi:hypothetical protein
MNSLWAQEEVASVDLGDERLDARAAMLLSTLGNRPNLSIPAACGGRAEMQAAYRFFDNEKVSFGKVLAPHARRTLERIGAQMVALLVGDTSEIDLTRPEKEVVGVGELDGSRRGLLLHAMQAFATDGTPLGTVWARCLNRLEGVSRLESQEKHRRRKQRPIEEKESMRWVLGLREARRIAAQSPRVQCIYVCDSEGDIYELLAEPRCESGGELGDGLADPRLPGPGLERWGRMPAEFGVGRTGSVRGRVAGPRSPGQDGGGGSRAASDACGVRRVRRVRRGCRCAPPECRCVRRRAAIASCRRWR